MLIPGVNVIKMVLLLLMMMVLKIMTSSMCTGVFVCAGGKPPCCTYCSAVLFLTDLLSVSLPLSLQIDLEPEGKVYVVIDLSGSSTEGKTTTRCTTEKQRNQTSEHTSIHSGL